MGNAYNVKKSVLLTQLKLLRGGNTDSPVIAEVQNV